MKKKTTAPKRKRKPIHNVEIKDVFEGLPPIDYVAITFWGRFILAGLFFRKAFACLIKGRAIV
jgi:hypothetical protein